jgi:hypothetical protein
MPVYKVPLKISCDEPSCFKRATHKVFDTWNSEQGKFCAVHAERWVEEWNRAHIRESS